jgi:uncharacterized protein YegP (UPF0339 family)
MAGSFKISQSKDGKFFFALVAENGQTVLTSQMYSAKQSAKDGIESVKKNAGDEARYERKQSKRGAPFFVLKAANAQVIGTSEEYSSAKAMEDGIASVKRLAKSAVLKDE